MLGVVLVGMMSLAVRYGAVPASAAAELRLPERQRAVVRTPKVDEVHELRRALRAHDASPAQRDGSVRYFSDFGDVLLRTGRRPGEALALRWEDVDLEGGWITIEGTVTRVAGVGLIRQEAPKSEASRRKLALPRSVLDALVRRRVNA